MLRKKTCIGRLDLYLNKIKFKKSQICNCAQSALFSIFKIDGETSKFTKVRAIIDRYDLKSSKHNLRNNKKKVSSIYFKVSDSTVIGHLEIKQFHLSDMI